MKWNIILATAATCVLFTGCENSHSNNADNTSRNVRDRDGKTLTAGDQSGTEADRDITQKIRKSLMDDANLSTNAKNVKIITINGVVTLRGPVNSDEEKERIFVHAREISGIRNIDNQIEVIRVEAPNP